MCVCLSEKRQAAEAVKALISDTEMLRHRRMCIRLHRLLNVHVTDYSVHVGEKCVSNASFINFKKNQHDRS